VLRPLRRDAQRNRQRILEAARELFASRGLSVTLNDVAHHAGVGVGTVYRRFPDKASLIEDLFEHRLAELEELMRQALADPDPWHGLTAFLERSLAMQAQDRGLKELVCGQPEGLERVCAVRDRLMPLAAALVARAKDAGALRAEIEAQDLPMIQLMLGALIDGAREVSPALWRRYLALVLRGMAADHARAPRLPVAAPAPEQVGAVMAGRRTTVTGLRARH